MGWIDGGLRILGKVFRPLATAADDVARVAGDDVLRNADDVWRAANPGSAGTRTQSLSELNSLLREALEGGTKAEIRSATTAVSARVRTIATGNTDDAITAAASRLTDASGSVLRMTDGTRLAHLRRNAGRYGALYLGGGTYLDLRADGKYDGTAVELPLQAAGAVGSALLPPGEGAQNAAGGASAGAGGAPAAPEQPGFMQRMLDNVGMGGLGSMLDGLGGTGAGVLGVGGLLMATFGGSAVRSLMGEGFMGSLLGPLLGAIVPIIGLAIMAFAALAIGAKMFSGNSHEQERGAGVSREPGSPQHQQQVRLSRDDLQNLQSAGMDTARLESAVSDPAFMADLRRISPNGITPQEASGLVHAHPSVGVQRDAAGRDTIP